MDSIRRFGEWLKNCFASKLAQIDSRTRWMVNGTAASAVNLQKQFDEWKWIACDFCVCNLATIQFTLNYWVIGRRYKCNLSFPICIRTSVYVRFRIQFHLHHLYNSIKCIIPSCDRSSAAPYNYFESLCSGSSGRQQRLKYNFTISQISQWKYPQFRVLPPLARSCPAFISDSAHIARQTNQKKWRNERAELEVIIMICNDLSFGLLWFGDDDLLLNVQVHWIWSYSLLISNRCLSTDAVGERAPHNSCNDF